MNFKLFNIIVLLVSCHLYAQDYASRNFTIEDGLPSSEVHDIYEDCNGFLWFATDRGIVRYDGQKFLVIDQDDGLPNQVVFNFVEESPTRVWISNVLNELYVFNPTKYAPKFEPYPHNYNLKKRFNTFRLGKYIRRFWVDKNGRFNFSFLSGTGKIVVDKEGKATIENRKVYDFNEVFLELIDFCDIVVTIDKNKAVYEIQNELRVDTLDPKDILIYDNTTSQLISTGVKYRHVAQAHTGIADAIQIGNQIKFIIGSQIFTYENSNVKVQELPYNGLRIGIRNGVTYICSAGGVLKEDTVSNQFEVVLNNAYCTDLYWDRTGGLWISSADKGIFNIPNTDVRSVKRYKEVPLVFTSIEANSKYIIGISLDSRQFVFDHQLNLLEVRNEVAFISGSYRSLRRDKEINSDYFEYGTLNMPDLWYIDKRYTQNYFGLKWPEYDNIHSYGAMLYDMDDDTTVVHKFNIPKIYHGLRLGPGRYLLATEEGLYIREPDQEPKPYSENPVFGSKITKIEKFRAGYVAATYMSGLIYFELDNDEPIIYDLSKGMSSSSISCFEIIDENTIWTGSYNGLDKLTFGESLNDVNILPLNKNNGLSSSEVLCMDSSNDTLYVGTKGGLNYFPLDIELQPKLLRSDLFRMDSVSVNKTRVAVVPDVIELQETDAIEFSFTQIAYSVGSDISYEYQIPEIDSTWIPVPGYLRLANLSNGVYTVNIRSVCENEKSTPYMIRLKVLNPWYKSWWAIIIYILLGLGIIAIVFRILLRRADKKRMAELEKAQLELKALISQMNPHFTFNTINSIQHYVIENESRKALDYLAEFALLMRQSLDFSRREYITLKEELDFLKLYVDLESKRFGKPIDFKIITDTRFDLDVIAFPALLLQPIIENAVVHGLQGVDYQGEISLKIIEHEKFFEIEISDNGKGLSKSKSGGENNHKSHGLDILKHRIKLYNAVNGKESDLQIIQGEEKGISTTVKIKLYKVNHINV